MKIIIVIIIVVIALAVGTGIGVSFTKMSSGSGADSSKLQEAKDMMKEQSSYISAMADTMTSNGLAMQVAGEKYKDDSLTTGGKDLTSVAKKYMEEDAKLTENDSSMK